MISDDGRSKKSENPFITFHHIGYIDQTWIQAPLRQGAPKKFINKRLFLKKFMFKIFFSDELFLWVGLVQKS